MTPTIATARLALRPLRKGGPRQVAWLRNPVVVRYSEQRHLDHTLSTQLRYINSFGGKSHLWAIFHVETGEHIGNLSARHDEPNNVSEVGILIGEAKFWRKGLANEAWKAVCDWLLDRDGGGVRKLEAGCMRANVAMVKIITGSGFTQEGELLNHFMLEDGGPVSALLYGRMR
jgi:RimJ/RimL family protein N-acetyltransferase